MCVCHAFYSQFRHRWYQYFLYDYRQLLDRASLYSEDDCATKCAVQIDSISVEVISGPSANSTNYDVDSILSTDDGASAPHVQIRELRKQLKTIEEELNFTKSKNTALNAEIAELKYELGVSQDDLTDKSIGLWRNLREHIDMIEAHKKKLDAWRIKYNVQTGRLGNIIGDLRKENVKMVDVTFTSFNSKLLWNCIDYNWIKHISHFWIFASSENVATTKYVFEIKLRRKSRIWFICIECFFPVFVFTIRWYPANNI